MNIFMISRQVFYPFRPALLRCSWFLVILLMISLSFCKKRSLVEEERSFAPLLTSSSERPFSLATLPLETRTCIINFFAPDCPPCIAEIPELQKLAAGIEKETILVGIGSVLVAASEIQKQVFRLKVEDIRGPVLQFASRYGLDYPRYLADGHDAESFGLTGYPETFIFSRDKDDRWQLQRKYISAVKASEVLEYTSQKKIRSAY